MRQTHAGIRPALALLVALFLLLAGTAAQARAFVVDQQEVTLQGLRQGISLTGEWRFRPGDDPAWASPDYDDSSWATMRVPARWPASGFPATGQMAWYRLELRLDPAAREELDLLHQLGVRLGKVLSAYEVYAGGALLSGAGRQPPNEEVDSS